LEFKLILAKKVEMSYLGGKKSAIVQLNVVILFLLAIC